MTRRMIAPGLRSSLPGAGRLLPRYDLVVTHRVAGSALVALAFGVPLLVLPREDHFYNAELFAAPVPVVQLGLCYK
jgi:UDP:flavonoid glycosyltransferase YjiC (YdhE family)